MAKIVDADICKVELTTDKLIITFYHPFSVSQTVEYRKDEISWIQRRKVSWWLRYIRLRYRKCSELLQICELFKEFLRKSPVPASPLPNVSSN